MSSKRARGGKKAPAATAAGSKKGSAPVTKDEDEPVPLDDQKLHILRLTTANAALAQANVSLHERASQLERELAVGARMQMFGAAMGISPAWSYSSLISLSDRHLEHLTGFSTSKKFHFFVNTGLGLPMVELYKGPHGRHRAVEPRCAVALTVCALRRNLSMPLLGLLFGISPVCASRTFHRMLTILDHLSKEKLRVSLEQAVRDPTSNLANRLAAMGIIHTPLPGPLPGAAGPGAAASLPPCPIRGFDMLDHTPPAMLPHRDRILQAVRLIVLLNGEGTPLDTSGDEYFATLLQGISDVTTDEDDDHAEHDHHQHHHHDQRQKRAFESFDD